MDLGLLTTTVFMGLGIMAKHVTRDTFYFAFLRIVGHFAHNASRRQDVYLIIYSSCLE